MAVAVLSELKITEEQYRRVMEELDLESAPSEVLAHVSYFTDKGVRVLDVWNSEEQWEAFMNERLAPTLERLAIKARPKFETHPVYNLYAPRGDELVEEGRSPHPA